MVSAYGVEVYQITGVRVLADGSILQRAVAMAHCQYCHMYVDMSAWHAINTLDAIVASADHVSLPMMLGNQAAGYC